MILCDLKVLFRVRDTDRICKFYLKPEKQVARKNIIAWLWPQPNLCAPLANVID